MVGSEVVERANDLPQLLLAAISRGDSEEIGGDLVQAEIGCERGKRLSRFLARNKRAGHQLAEVPGIEQSLVQGLEAFADRLNLPLVTGEIKQSGSIASC